MKVQLEKLLKIMLDNRQRHGKVWRKVRRDRIFKLFPELEDHGDVESVIQFGIMNGDLETCHVALDDDMIPAIKLKAPFTYNPHLREF